MFVDTKDETLETILRYVKSEDELGFQLNGPWGSGKTYYFKKTIKPKLEKENKVLIYISLNGFKNIEMVNSLLSRKLLVYLSRGRLNKYGIYEFTERVLNLFSLAELPIPIIGGNFGVNTNPLKNGVKRLKGNAIKKAMKDFGFNDLVIVIDDLERISDSLKIKEVFGYLATIQEQWGCKIILISNEEAYKDATEFKNGKEKVVNKSLEFTRSVADVAEDIIKGNLERIDKKDEALNGWIVEESKFLLSNVDNINLRTVKSVMGTYGELVERIDKEKLSDEQKQQMKKTGFLSIFVLTDCFKRNIPLDGNYTKDLFGPLASFSIHGKFFKKILNDSFGNSTSKKAENDDAKTTELICKKFHEKLDEFDRNILYSVAIKNLVEHGFFVAEAYTADIKKRFFYEKKLVSQENFQKLCNFRALSDNELESIQHKVSNSLDCSKNDIDYLLQVLNLFTFFNNKGLNLVDLKTDDLREEIRQKIFVANKSEIEEISIRISEGHLDNEDSLVKAFDSRKKDLRKEDDEDLFKSVLHCNWYGNDEFFKEQSFFKMLIDSNEVNKIVQGRQSSDIQNLGNYIDAERSQFARDTYNNNEPKHAKEFAEKLKKLEPQVKGKVQLFNYQELESTVNEIVQAAEEKVDNNHGK